MDSKTSNKTNFYSVIKILFPIVILFSQSISLIYYATGISSIFGNTVTIFTPFKLILSDISFIKNPTMRFTGIAVTAACVLYYVFLFLMISKLRITIASLKKTVHSTDPSDIKSSLMFLFEAFGTAFFYGCVYVFFCQLIVPYTLSASCIIFLVVNILTYIFSRIILTVIQTNGKNKIILESAVNLLFLLIVGILLGSLLSSLYRSTLPLLDSQSITIFKGIIKKFSNSTDIVEALRFTATIIAVFADSIIFFIQFCWLFKIMRDMLVFSERFFSCTKNTKKFLVFTSSVTIIRIFLIVLNTIPSEKKYKILFICILSVILAIAMFVISRNLYRVFNHTPAQSKTFTEGIITKEQLAEFNNLTEVTLKHGVVGISKHAFTNQYNLTDIYIPGTVTYVGKAAFNKCSSLNNIYCHTAQMPANWHPKCFDGCNAQIHWAINSNPKQSK